MSIRREKLNKFLYYMINPVINSTLGRDFHLLRKIEKNFSN